VVDILCFCRTVPNKSDCIIYVRLIYVGFARRENLSIIGIDAQELRLMSVL
jgi:hypothetical protein